MLYEYRWCTLLTSPFAHISLLPSCIMILILHLDVCLWYYPHYSLYINQSKTPSGELCLKAFRKGKMITSLLALYAALGPASAMTTPQQNSSISQSFTTVPASMIMSSAIKNALPTTATTTCPIPLQEPGKPAATKIANLKTPDEGYKFGNAIIRNNCEYSVFVRSVGAHYLNGPRNKTSGFGSEEDDCFHEITPAGIFIEPFRASAGCMYQGEPIYCQDEDRLAGQAISFKISFDREPSAPITQFEYALYQNPIIKDPFKKLIYDVSLLDCGQPAENVVDFNATVEMHNQKLAQCPGYSGGVAVSFDADPHGNSCPPIFCDGKDKCYMIYTWDRTRKQESTFICDKEYRGNMTLDLCATKGNDVQQKAEAFDMWAKTATNEVLLLDKSKTATSAAGLPASALSLRSSFAVSSGNHTAMVSSPSTLRATASTVPAPGHSTLAEASAIPGAGLPESAISSSTRATLPAHSGASLTSIEPSLPTTSLALATASDSPVVATMVQRHALSSSSTFSTPSALSPTPTGLLVTARLSQRRLSKAG